MAMKIFTNWFSKPLPENFQADSISKNSSGLLLKYLLLIFGFALITSTNLCAQQPVDPNSFFLPPADNSPDKGTQGSSQIGQTNPAGEFVNMGKTMIGQGNYLQAKEALKTALRISPMDHEIWLLYDEATIGEYIAARRTEKLSPVIERDIAPLFEISRVDTYIELDTLYVVGSIRNLSKKLRQKIQITARIFDDKQKELRRHTGPLKLAQKGLLPNESSLFEIPFKNPPANARVFRVEVSNFE